MHRALDFIEQANCITSRQALFNLLATYMEKLGFGVAVYSDLRAQPSAARTFLFSNLPEPARQDYARRQIRNRVAIAAMASNIPLLWKETAHRGKDTELLNWMRDHCIMDGIIVPLHEAMGSTMAISVGTQEKSVSVARMVPIVEMFAVQFHLAYQHLDQPPPAIPSLTMRETEILRWCAAGKSNWDIGDILSISAHTVDFHLRNVYRKLGTGDRVTAALKAFMLGLISLPF